MARENTFAERLASVEKNLAGHEEQIGGASVATELRSLREDVRRLLAELGLTPWDDMSHVADSRGETSDGVSKIDRYCPTHRTGG